MCTRLAATCCAALLAGLLLTRPARAFDPPVRTPGKVSETHLANGLTVLMEEDRTLPVVSLRLRYRVGARHDPAGKAGLAVLTERMMIQATKHVGDGDYFRYLDRAGATRVDQGAGYDATWFQVTVPANRIALPLWLLSDQMGFFVERADQPLLDQQREMLRNERRERKENAPNGLLAEFIQAELLPFAHPYHNPIIGPAAELDSLTVGDVQSFHQRWFAPDQAILVLSGHLDRAEAMALIEKYFGPIPAARTPAPPAPPAPSLQGETRIEVAARVERPLVSFAWNTPAWFASGDAEIAVIGKLLAGMANALILWKVGDEMKIASRATADYVPRQLVSMLDVRVTLAPDHQPQEVITAVGEVLDQLRGQTVRGEQIERATGERLLSFAMSLERPSARVEWYSTWRQLTGKADYSDAEFERYNAVTPQTVRSAASQWLDRNRVVTVVTPTAGAPVCGAVSRVTRSQSP